MTKTEKVCHPNHVFLIKLLWATGIKNQNRLAKALEITPCVISNIKSGKIKIGASHLVRILEITGWHIRDLRLMMQESGIAT